MDESQNLHQGEKRTAYSYRWLLLGAFVLGAAILLYIFLQMRPGRAAMIPFILGPKILLALGAIGLAAGIVLEMWHGSFAGLIRLRSLAGFGLLAVAILFSLLGFRSYPSSYDTRPSSTCFRLPFNEDIAVMQGGASLDENYHAGSPAQRYAYDLALIREGSTHKGEGYVVWDYHIYGQPVLSPSDGRVISISDGDADQSPSSETSLSYTNPGGNHIVIETGTGEFLFLGHLQPGSIRVKAGERVTIGQELALAGNSGQSGAPHLHVHLQDSPEANGGEGIPMHFCGYTSYDLDRDSATVRFVERGMPTGRERKQVIRSIR